MKMHLRLNFVLLLTYYSIIHVKAEWNYRRALIVNQSPAPRGWGRPTFKYNFPSTVRRPSRNSPITYLEESESTITRTYYLCEYDDSGRRWEGCLFPHSLQDNNTKPLCNNSQGMIEPGLRELGTQCGNQNEFGYLLNFSYEICKYEEEYDPEKELEEPTNRKLLTIYNACYDSSMNKHHLYSYFIILSPKLLNNELLADEANVMINHDDRQLQPVNWNGYTYVRQMVLPPKLMAFALPRYAFHDAHNFAYMLENLTGVWDNLIDNIKTALINSGRPVKIYAGTYQAQTFVENVGVIPKLWWITIYNAKADKGTTIMMPNTPNGGNQPKMCNTSICNKVPWTIPSMMYCCKATVIGQIYNLPSPGTPYRF